ncbi:MAG: ion transporter [Bacteroidales bacterium]|nr:ion transporter [Bacteroidales bacterium]
MKQIFLNERLILAIIIINAIVIFTQECGVTAQWIGIVDVVCSLIFMIEMAVKHHEYGVKGYWSNGWNVMDGILVICSLPSVIALFIPTGMMDLSFLLILRILRVFRFFRLVHAFPGFTKIAHNFGLALKQSYAVMLGLIIMVITFALISCSLFREAVPDYFGNPFDAIYSTFRIFTGEGWNEIPDTVGEAVSPIAGHLVRVYFCLILVIGCIIGMSLLNSIFVDAMVSDNNDDVKDQIKALEEKIDKLLEGQKSSDDTNPTC